MADTIKISEAKRTLLEKYIRAERLQSVSLANNSIRNDKPQTTVADKNVIAIQESGTKKPFFFLQGDWISGAYWCFPLASELGSMQPFYALEPYKFENLEALPTFEEIARVHLKSLQSVQPEGPYYLGGFCNGGLLAYEIARQLHAQGYEVDLLVLVDPMGLVYPVKERFSHTVIARLSHLLKISQKKRLAYFVLLRHLYRYMQHEYRYIRFNRYRKLQSGLKPEQINTTGGILQALKALHELWLDQRHDHSENVQSDNQVDEEGLKFPSFKELFPEPIFPNNQIICNDYPAIYDWIAMFYRPSSLFLGNIVFIWDSGDYGRSGGWKQVVEANNADVHVIDGKQSLWKTKNLQVLAKLLSECLDKKRDVESESK